MFNKKSGFSLVELSVVLTVIGLTLSGALTLATKKTESDKIEETTEKMERIEQAIELFLSQYQRLPCPSDASVADTSANFGVEGTPSAADQDADLDFDGVCTLANFNNGAGQNIFAGGVPVRRSLTYNHIINLTYDDMFDGWGRRFLYVVDARLANSIATSASCLTNSACFKKTADGSIIIWGDTTGTNITTTTAAYAIISTGKNGNGAFTYLGSATRLADSADTGETENMPTTGVTTINNVFISKDSTATFDDMVTYQTKGNIIVGANGSPAEAMDTDLCTSSAYQVAFPAATDSVCYGIAVDTMCKAMAARIDSLCFE
jgi:prepilin-type N-terminal cleavage/methylation domain-containing protein